MISNFRKTKLMINYKFHNCCKDNQDNVKGEKFKLNNTSVQ